MLLRTQLWYIWALGGHDNGDVASRLVAETIVHSFLKKAQTLSLQKRVISSCENAKSEMDNFTDVGTAVASVAIKDNFAVFAHSGITNRILKPQPLKRMTRY